MSVIQPSRKEEVNAATTNQLVAEGSGCFVLCCPHCRYSTFYPKNECLKIKMSSTTNQLLIEGSLFSFLVVLVRYSTCNTKIWKSFQLCPEKARRQCCNKPAVVRDLYLVVHSKYSTTWYLLLTRNQFMQVSAVTKPKSMLQRISITWKDLGAPHYP